MLECLLAADGRPVPAEELLERVWDEAADPFTSTVKTTIGRLRAKLGDPPVIADRPGKRLPHRGALMPRPPPAAPPYRPAAADRPVRRGVPGLRRGRARGRRLPALRVHPEPNVLPPAEKLRVGGVQQQNSQRRRSSGRAVQHRAGPRSGCRRAAGRPLRHRPCSRYRARSTRGQKPPVYAARGEGRGGGGEAPATAQVQVNYDKQEILILSPSPWRSSRWRPPRSAG